MQSLSLPLGLIFALSASLHAAPTVRFEQAPVTPGPWKFKDLPGPSKSDIAQDAEINRTAGSLDSASGHPGMLVNGKLPETPRDLGQLTFFAGLSSFVIDLGTTQPITSVNSFSCHDFPDDQGARGPQVYTLSGSLDNRTWTKIADVDTRPNKTGDKWSGRYAASITDSNGKLGDFRYLKFDIQPTYSPKQGNALWTNTLFSEIDVHTAATLPKAGDAKAAEPLKVTDVWVVTKTHFDIGFTDQAVNVMERYRVEMMDKSLKVMEDNRKLPPNQRFTWSVPGWPLLVPILGPEQDPARKAKVEQAIREGSLAVHALGASTHTESFDPESLVRSLGFSSKISRTYGHPLPLAAKMTDVPSHSWILPTLLEHAGIKFLHLGCNPASQFPRVPHLFWWQGADGSRVLTAYTLDYGSSLTPPPNWPSKHYLAMIMTGDNHGPPSTQDVDGMRKNLEKSMPGVRVHFGKLDDFARAVLEEKPDLQVIRGDMPDTWIHGLQSNPAATVAYRNTQALAPVVDALDTQLQLWKVKTPELSERLAKAYEGVFLYGEHTWGMNAEYGPRYQYGDDIKKWFEAMEKEPVPAEGDYAKVPRGSKRKWLQSYQDHRDYALDASRIIQEELGKRLEILASNVKAAPGSIVVYNPLPWKRSGVVEVDGKTYFASAVPAGGYMTLENPSGSTDTKEPSDPSSTSLETAHFKATFDLQRGGISSLVEKSTGRELADKSSPYALGQFLHERFSTNEVNRFFHKYSRMQHGWGLNDLGKPGMPDASKIPYLASTPDDWRIKVVRGTLDDRVTLSNEACDGLAKSLSLVFTFPKHEAWVDVDWKIEDKTAEKHPEGAWLCFPFAVENPKFTVGRPGAPIDPAKDIVPGTNRHLMAVETGVAITGDDMSGAAVCPIGSPLVSLDQPGLWWWTMDYVPSKPSVFVNLSNNMWNTNFPLWQSGSWSDRVRIWPVSGKSPTVQDLATCSWEARLPLRAAKSANASGSLPTSQSGITVSRPGVLVTAFGQNPDGKGTLLRVWDFSGIDGRVEITLPGSFKQATPVNLRGENPGKPLTTTNGSLNIELKAYSPASFLLD